MTPRLLPFPLLLGLLGGLVALLFVASLLVGPSDLGLDPPAYVLTVYLKSGTKHVLEIGDKTPSESGYYTRFDGKRLLVVELSSIEGLTLMADNPPYQVTPTPSPLPVTMTPEAVTPYP